ncbi:MAG: hypothetical protein GY749_32340 [Desulfobacteraceae bacterium]|nr:hypothetical protein [Desulfobacteraceae bacterium]
MSKKTNQKTFIAFLFFFFFLLSARVFAVDTEALKTEHRNLVVDTSGSTKMVIRAYEGLDLDADNLEAHLQGTLNSKNPDFSIIRLVRILFFSDKYDDEILPVLASFNYWLVKNEVDYSYNSENHLIMWMSSAWLLNQKYGWNVGGSTLEQRLRHYLKLKLQYGFYEFNSPTYAPFTLAGLLNLADFAEDTEIRDNARLAAIKLLKQMMLYVNNKGAFFPVAGRSYGENYDSYWDSESGEYSPHMYNRIIYLTTGLGVKPVTCGSSSVFVATSGVNFDEVADSWSESFYTTFSSGHYMGDSKEVHAGLSRVDRTLFQWSAGGYFHPAVADDSTYTADYYNITEDQLAGYITEMPNLPDWFSDLASKIGATLSRSSDISHHTAKIFKNKGVVLTSLKNFYTSYMGWQQWPVVATCDDIAVWTQSGEVKTNWDDRSRNNANTHLPYLNQDENVVLIGYWPNFEISSAGFFGAMDTDVAVYWPEDEFDETEEYRNWLIGRKNDSYIAVYRHTDDIKNGHYYSDSGRQLWAIVVGNEDMHGSYSNFVDIIKRASTTEEYYLSFYVPGMVYKIGVNVDGKNLSHRWTTDQKTA